MPSSRRLAVVLSHPNQYYSPWFRWLAAHTPLTLRVFYLWDAGVTSQTDPQFGATFKWDVDLLGGYEHEFVPNTAPAPSSFRFGGLRNPTLPARLAAWHPDAILLFGYAYATHLRLILWARLHRVPLIFRGDSHLLGRGAPPFLTRCALRFLYAQFAALLPVGAANRDYFTLLGVPPHRLHFAPHAVDTTLYDPTDPAHAHAATALRAHLGLTPATRVVLFAGKFSAAKQPRELLAAFLALRPRDTALIFVGDGEEKPALHALAATAPAGTVHFLPFANQTEMPARYLLADLFVLPSRGHYETWGLAVNEAMHLGVPALVSDRVGCQRDLVTDNSGGIPLAGSESTGWVFPADTPGALQEKLSIALAAVADPTTRARLRASLATRIAGYTYAQTTAGLLAALPPLVT